MNHKKTLTLVHPNCLKVASRRTAQISVLGILIGLIPTLLQAHTEKHPLDNVAYATLLDLPQKPARPVLYEPVTHRPLKGAKLDQLVANPSPSRTHNCEVNFNDEDALDLTEPSLWFDRIRVPWWQHCGNYRYVDIRPLHHDHVHLGFESDHVEPCPSSEQAFPSHLDDDMNCSPVDIPTEPRTHITTHTADEVISIRMYNQPDYIRKKFSLTQLRVLGSHSIDLCFNHSLNTASDWKASEPPQENEQPGWYCWESIGPGYWNLAPWVSNVADIRITVSGSGVFSLDDLKFEW